MHNRCSLLEPALTVEASQLFNFQGKLLIWSTSGTTCLHMYAMGDLTCKSGNSIPSELYHTQSLSQILDPNEKPKTSSSASPVDCLARIIACKSQKYEQDQLKRVISISFR